MHYKLLLVILSLAMLFNSCSDSTEPESDGLNILKEIKMEGYETWKMIMTSDSCIVIGGKKDHKPGIMKLDLDGNIIWESYCDMTIVSYYMSHLEETQSGDFLLSGSIPYGAPYIAKYDKDGNMLWEKTSGHSIGSDSYLKAMTNSQDETIIVTGLGVSKISNTGDLIWGHYYYEDGYQYTYDNAVFRVYDVYDAMLNYNDEIVIIYESPICELVKMIIDDDGNYVKGNHFHINIAQNAKIFRRNDRDRYYILGSEEVADDEKHLFLLEFSTYNYWDPYKMVFGEASYFGDYIIDVSKTAEGGFIATSYNDHTVFSFEKYPRNFEWSYTFDDLTINDDLHSTVKLNGSKYALIMKTKWAENDSTVYGSKLLFFEKN